MTSDNTNASGCSLCRVRTQKQNLSGLVTRWRCRQVMFTSQEESCHRWELLETDNCQENNHKLTNTLSVYNDL